MQFCFVAFVPKYLNFATFSDDLLINRAVIAQSVKLWATDWTIGVLGLDSRRGL
jgi:hypothetical protein